MPDSYSNIYERPPLDEYSFFERLKIRAAGFAFYSAIKLIGMTVRFEVRGGENLEAVESSGHMPILACWHDRIFLSVYFWKCRGLVVMISKSFDGEFITRAVHRFGFGAIRGSSSRGGSKALVQMIKAMRSGLSMVFTVDGPRGPRYEVKQGPILLAKKTGNPVLPFSIEAMNSWTIRSWDRMQIPKPFTKAVVLIGEPIYLSLDDGMSPDAAAERLQAALDGLVEEGNRWRTDLKP